MLIPQNQFDSGPLSTVREEIGHSWSEALIALHKWLGDADIAPTADAAQSDELTRALSQLHQVTGALSMVGLAAATHVNHEAEKLASVMSTTSTMSTTAAASNAQPDRAGKIAAIEVAVKTLSTYLDDLIRGEPDRPLKLQRTYENLNTLRGAADASSSDLFFPDLMLTTPPPHPGDLPPASVVFSDAIKHVRSIYQTGLLALLRDRDLAGGMREMRRATTMIEALKAASPARAFWFVASGFFDAIALDPKSANISSKNGPSAVQLFGKIDQQIKLLIDGPRDAPEQLFRDVLYIVGKSNARSEPAEHIAQIRAIYGLDHLLWEPPEPENNTRTVELLNTARAQLSALKDSFLSIGNSDRTAIALFAEQSESLAATGAELPNRELAQVMQIVGGLGKHLNKSNILPNKMQGLEIATTLLFVESSLEDYFQLTSEFGGRASEVCRRLRSAITGADLDALEKPVNQFADTMTLRAQTHLLIFQVGREVQINLATVEGVLDDYFRDAKKSTTLPTITPLMKQIEGALTMLDLDEAANLSAAISKHIAVISARAQDAETKRDAHLDHTIADTQEAIAAVDGMTALGLYISALQRGTADPRAVLLPILIREGLATAEKIEPQTRAKRVAVARAAVIAPALAVASVIESVNELAIEPAIEPFIEPVTAPIAAPVPAATPAAADAPLPALTFTSATETDVGGDSKVNIAPDELVQLRDTVAQLQATITERNKRIHALELVIKSLNNKGNF